MNDDLISASLEDAKCLNHNDGFLDTCEDCKNLREYVKAFQCHKCTQSCKKKKQYIHILGCQGLGLHEEESCEIISHICRYKYPRCPIDVTTLLLPISKAEDPKKVTQMQKDWKHIRAYLIRRTHFFESKENEKIWIQFKNMTFEEFLQDLGMYAGLSSNLSQDEKKTKARERYLNALRANISGSGYVYLKRNTEDVFTNNYSRVLMLIVKCNHDLQYISDEHGCLNYVTAYVTKHELGSSQFLKQLEEELKNLGQMDQLKHIGSQIDKKRECSIQEVIYRVLGLPMSKFSTRVKFISTNHPQMRDGLLKENMNSLEETEPVFYWSPHQYYEHRPEEYDDLCLADFVANFEYGQRSTPSAIPLDDDAGFLYQRSKPAVIRYYLHYDEPEDLARGLLILFYPFVNEMRDIHQHNVIELLDENKDMIDEKRKTYERNINLVGMMEEIEKIQEQRDTEEASDIEQEEYERDDEFETTSEKDIANFIGSMKSLAKKDVTNNSDIKIPKINELREKIVMLNHDQRKIFDDIAERLFALNSDSDQFCIYIAGSAGTGKSFLLRLIIDAARYLLMSSGDVVEKPSCLIMAPTANAASIIGGKTIESCLGINPHSQWNYVKASQERQSNLKFVYEDVRVLFIDELSMLGCNKLSKINYQLQSFQDGAAKTQFMGGKSLIMGGDLKQLPSVNDRMIFEKSTLDGRSPLALSYWDEYFTIYYLEEKMRSSGDLEYGSLCDRVGEGKITPQDEQYFLSRVIPTELENSNENFKNGIIAILVTTNKQREKINLEKLNSLLPQERTYRCTSVDRTLNLSSGKTLPKDLPHTQTGSLPGDLHIKVGAPVVITMNHKNKRWKEDGIINGARGFIEEIDVNEDDPEEVTVVWVVFQNKEHGTQYRAAPEHLKLRNFRNLSKYATPILPTRKTFKYKSGNIEYQRKQFSLTLAYAITVHKVNCLSPARAERFV